MDEVELVLSASNHGWQCTNCHQLYDALWRPIPRNKAWKPPVIYNWILDKPIFKYCPMCGAEFRKETARDTAACSFGE